MARIPTVTPNQFSAHEQAVVDRFLGARGKFPHEGPYSTMLHIPEVALHVDTLRRFLRDEASPPQKLQELVMITVAREMDCAYIWHAHSAAACHGGARRYY